MLKFLIRSFSISLNHRTKRKCSNHIKHPPTNAGTEQSLDFSAVIQLTSGRCSSKQSRFMSNYTWFSGWIDTFNSKIPSYSLPVLLFKICILSFFHPKGKLHKFTLLPQQLSQLLVYEIPSSSHSRCLIDDGKGFLQILWNCISSELIPWWQTGTGSF